jgi:hypothetical protein
MGAIGKGIGSWGFHTRGICSMMMGCIMRLEMLFGCGSIDGGGLLCGWYCSYRVCWVFVECNVNVGPVEGIDIDCSLVGLDHALHVFFLIPYST